MSALPDTWPAHLTLSFACQGAGRSVLSSRRHTGPLLVQKALYPEGPAVWHVTILHPPSGIAGGDELTIDVRVGGGAHALLTTPGAAGGYTANGRTAIPQTQLRVKAGARLDRLPLENMFLEQTDAALQNHIDRHGGSAAIGWEINQLGRIQAATHWDEGRVSLAST